jgi:4-carboxymuconolactone decarboxylase
MLYQFGGAVMAKSRAYQAGRETRRQAMGEAMVERMAQSAYDDRVMCDFVDYAVEAVWGLLWSRPGLDMKTRTLISVVSVATQARWEELAMYLRMARQQGWTEEELSEVLLHLAGYVGLPSAREAMLTAKEVFKELRDEA